MLFNFEPSVRSNLRIEGSRFTIEQIQRYTILLVFTNIVIQHGTGQSIVNRTGSVGIGKRIFDT